MKIRKPLTMKNDLTATSDDSTLLSQDNCALPESAWACTRNTIAAKQKRNRSKLLHSGIGAPRLAEESGEVI